MTPADFIAIRKAAGLSQTGLAALLGVTRSTVARYEAKERGVRIPHLVDLFMRGLKPWPE